MRQFFAVCLGGAVGTGARYLLADVVVARIGAAFPYATLLINGIGSFLIAFVLQIAVMTSFISPTLRVVLATGVFGGFTTYSTFNHETVQLLQTGAVGRALANIGVMLATCLLAGFFGLMAARRMCG